MKKALIMLGLALLMNEMAFGDSGVWVKGNWAQVHTYCTQTYVCSPSSSILHPPDTVVRTSSPVMKVGVCNTSGGPFDSCNACSSSQPSEPCNVWVEKK